MQTLKKLAKRIFRRPVRAALYGSGIAGVAALVGSGEIPAWAAPIGAPLLLALLNLSPADVDDDPAPNQD